MGKDLKASNEDPYVFDIARIKRNGEMEALRYAIFNIISYFVSGSAWEDTDKNTHMIWTKDKPTSPGWYWWRNETGTGTREVRWVLGRCCVDGIPVTKFPGEWSSEPIKEQEEQKELG